MSSSVECILWWGQSERLFFNVACRCVFFDLSISYHLAGSLQGTYQIIPYGQVTPSTTQQSAATRGAAARLTRDGST